MVANAPRYANSPSSCLFRRVRSAIAPTTGRTNTCSRTDSEMTYGKNDSARIAMPNGRTNPSAPAAACVTVVRYGPRNTVTTVVLNAEQAQS